MGALIKFDLSLLCGWGWGWIELAKEAPGFHSYLASTPATLPRLTITC